MDLRYAALVEEMRVGTEVPADSVDGLISRLKTIVVLLAISMVN